MAFDTLLDSSLPVSDTASKGGRMDRKANHVVSSRPVPPLKKIITITYGEPIEYPYDSIPTPPNAIVRMTEQGLFISGEELMEALGITEADLVTIPDWVAQLK